MKTRQKKNTRSSAKIADELVLQNRAYTINTTLNQNR